MGSDAREQSASPFSLEVPLGELLRGLNRSYTEAHQHERVAGYMYWRSENFRKQLGRVAHQRSEYICIRTRIGAEPRGCALQRRLQYGGGAVIQRMCEGRWRVDPFQ